MKNILEEKVYYADTDAYGVVWHGTYLRWMEKGKLLRELRSYLKISVRDASPHHT